MLLVMRLLPLTFVLSVDAALPNFQACISDASKKLPFCDASLDIEKRLDDLMSRMTLHQKVQQITPATNLGVDACTTMMPGVPELDLPAWLWLVETNTNVASACQQEGRCATTFIGPMGLGASFNRSSWRAKGGVFGSEIRALSNIGASRFHLGHPALIGTTGFGPNLNIARDPRFGRSSELPGEDPFLTGTYGFEMVSGMQEKDAKGYPKMAAFLKHFTAYSTEKNRGHDTYSISTFDFFDTYLPQYERAIKADPAGVMCSYNGENGVPSCANDWLLNKQLRSWKPDAMVTTDCGAVGNLKGAPVHAPDDVHAAAYALMNGTDLEMGDTQFGQLEDAVKLGLATEKRIEEAARRGFRVLMQVGRFDPPAAMEWSKFGLETLNSTLHQQISYEAALQGLVLLRNDCVSEQGGAAPRCLLPLRQGANVAVVGPQALARAGLLSDYAADQICFNGTDSCITSIAEGVAGANVGGTTKSAAGVDVNSQRTDGIAAALAVAKAADVVVLAMGIDKPVEHEGIDRSDTALPGLQLSFARQVLALGKPTVLVLTNGGALAIDELVERPRAGSAAPAAGYAIVEAFNPAVLGAKALGASLFGLENRWGKLPVTMYPHSYIKEQSMTNYDMSVAPGRTYRYYNGTPLFHFGYGLSLTTFRLSNCKISPAQASGYVLTCSLTNTGSRDGDEVVQVYHVARDIGAVDHPVPKRALVEFDRLRLASGATTEVKFQLSVDALKLVNKEGTRTLYPGKHGLIVSRGHADDEIEVEIQVGAEDSFIV